jgi:NagD protein
MTIRQAHAKSRNTRPLAVICDLDGVLHRGKRCLPGAKPFWQRLCASGRPYLFLTNSPEETPRELHVSLKKLGFDIPENRFYTSAEATAALLMQQKKRARVFVIGTQGLKKTLQRAGLSLVEKRPQYVVVGSGGQYNVALLKKAVRAVHAGANLIATNSEMVGLTEDDIQPGTGALVSPIQLATGIKPFFIGKPNHLMVQAAMRRLNVGPGEAYVIGDQMETDVLVGLQTGLRTILIMQGRHPHHQLLEHPYHPDYVFKNAGQIPLHRLP